MDMNKIYIIAIPTGKSSYGTICDAEITGDTYGVAIKDDGSVLATHYSSGVNWTMHDMGITSDWKHEIYQNECPDGYILEWVEFHNWQSNTEFKKVLDSLQDDFPFADKLKQ